MSHPLFTPEARLLLEKDETDAMQAFCETLHPATVAESLAADAFTVEDVWRFLVTTSIANQAAIFVYFPLEWQVQLVEGTGRPHMARLIEQMSHDDRADLLRRLEPKVADSLLRLVDEADRRDIATLVKYPENTAGALMTTDYAWLPANITVEQALDRLRLQAPNSETIYYVYVVDDQRRLLGVLTLRELILAPRKAFIKELMDTQPFTVKVSDDREKVAQDLTHYDLLAIPVLDAENRLVASLPMTTRWTWWFPRRLRTLIAWVRSHRLRKIISKRVSSLSGANGPRGWRFCSWPSCLPSRPCRISRTRLRPWSY